MKNYIRKQKYRNNSHDCTPARVLAHEGKLKEGDWYYLVYDGVRGIQKAYISPFAIPTLYLGFKFDGIPADDEIHKVLPIHCQNQELDINPTDDDLDEAFNSEWDLEAGE